MTHVQQQNRKPNSSRQLGKKKHFLLLTRVLCALATGNPDLGSGSGDRNELFAANNQNQKHQEEDEQIYVLCPTLLHATKRHVLCSSHMRLLILSSSHMITLGFISRVTNAGTSSPRPEGKTMKVIAFKSYGKPNKLEKW